MMNPDVIQKPTCQSCNSELVEMWNGSQQIMVCPEPHAVETRDRFSYRGFVMLGDPPPMHRMFDRCRYDGPATFWEDDVTCLRCRGWQQAQKKPNDDVTHIEINMNARLRREAVVCAVDGGRQTKRGNPVSHTLCGKTLDKARQRVASQGPQSGYITLVSCPKCWEKRPKFIRDAEAKLLNF